MIKEHKNDIQRLEIYGGEILIMDNVLKIMHCGKHDENNVIPFQIEIPLYKIDNFCADADAIIIEVNNDADKGSVKHVFYKTAAVQNIEIPIKDNYLHYKQFYALKTFLCFLSTV